jgi:LSD1 subclass zinc finger protein
MTSAMPGSAGPRRVKVVFKQLQAVMRCSQCGESLIYQGNRDAPRCTKCGWESPSSWTDQLNGVFRLRERLGRPDGNSSLMSTVKVEVNLKTVPSFHCPHCQAAQTPDERMVTEGTCAACRAALALQTVDEAPEGRELILVVPAPGPRAVDAPIAMTCSSCRGPLSVEATARTVVCSFCSASNVVPVLATARVALDTVYAALLVVNEKVPRDWIFSDTPAEVISALHDHRKTSFAASELVKVMSRHRDEADVFKAVQQLHINAPGLEVAEVVKDSAASETAGWARKFLASHQEALARYAAEQRAKARVRRNKNIVSIALLILVMVGLMALISLSPPSTD